MGKGTEPRKRLTVADLAAQVAELSAQLEAIESQARKVAGRGPVCRIDASTLGSARSGFQSTTRGQVTMSAGEAMNIASWLREAEANGTTVPSWLDIDELAAAAFQGLLRFDTATLAEGEWI
jgi:hypothetical protein